MKKCVFCGNEFEELSKEHIIPNVLCGHLKSKNLICSKCNNTFGTEIDSAFNGVFSQIITMFSIKRERGEQQPIIVKDITDGKKYKCFLDKKYELAECYFNFKKDENGKVAINIQGPVDKTKIKTDLEKYCKLNREKLDNLGITIEKIRTSTQKFIDDNWNELSNSTVTTKPFLFVYQSSFSNREILFAILKILFLFLKESAPHIEFNELKLLEILKYKLDEICNICSFYPFKENLFKEKENTLSHQIYIKGDSEQKAIIGYIKLFSIAPFVCLIDSNYFGEDFTCCYAYDYISKNEFTPICNEISCYDDIIARSRDITKQDKGMENVKKDLSRIFNMYYRINPKAKWNEIQFAVEKRLKEQLQDDDIVNTKLFQFALNQIGELGNFRFNEDAPKEEIKQLIDNFATAIINYVVYEIKQYLKLNNN